MVKQMLVQSWDDIKFRRLEAIPCIFEVAWRLVGIFAEVSCHLGHRILEHRALNIGSHLIGHRWPDLGA